MRNTVNPKLLQLKIVTMCSYLMEACLEFIQFNQILSINLRHIAYPMVGQQFRVGVNLGTPKTFFSVNGMIMLLDLESLVGFLYHLLTLIIIFLNSLKLQLKLSSYYFLIIISS